MENDGEREGRCHEDLFEKSIRTIYIYVGRSSRDVFDIWRSRIRASSSSFTEKQVRERERERKERGGRGNRNEGAEGGMAGNVTLGRREERRWSR